MSLLSSHNLPVSIVAIATLCVACGDGGTSSTNGVEDADYALSIIDRRDTIAVNPWDSAMNMPDDGCIKLKILVPALNLHQQFNDSNQVHYSAAEQLGISPIINDSTAWSVSRPLLYVESGPTLLVEEMKYAYPYLVPEANALLHEIGQRFHDSLQSRGGGSYRPRVTSMLRTTSSISKLRRVNRASVDSSVHRFGTTFDISYTRFAWDGDDNQPRRTQEDLKNLLGEILLQMRDEGRCYVKFERKPGCYHITTRR